MASSSGSAMDNLSLPLRYNVVPNQEYLLQGSVLDHHVEVLLQRLRGLCDDVDSGPESFHDHEMCFTLSNNDPATPALSLRVRKALDVPEAPLLLRYIGQPEIGDANRPTIVRSSIDVACSSTVVEFITEMGCRMDFEYIARGYMIKKGRMKITVSKLFKMGGGIPNQPDESMEPLTHSYLVELSVLAPSGQDALGEEMRVFADQLKPTVTLDKINYNKLSKFL